MMTKFAFFEGKEDRWGDNMRALQGSLSICPSLAYLELPYHTLEELNSICHLKIWVNTQEPHDNMAYLLVCLENDLKVGGYGMALVWVSPHQARASMMEEALETLSTCFSSRPDWPYILAWSYKGSNHMPLPKNKHLGILPQTKVEESLYGWISQLAVCQLLSARPQVIYPVGLNGSDQPVIIDLPEPLFSSSSITLDEHPHLWINIPLPTPKEPEYTTLPLGGVHAIPTDIIPKTPWKPRITLMAEVNNLLDRGMADNYDRESEHPSTGQEATTEAGLPPPTKEEVPAPSLDTSSQASIGEMDTSLESNPVDVYPSTAACSSRSSSPTVDLAELQEGANLAATHNAHIDYIIINY